MPVPTLSPRPLRHGRAWLLHCAILVAALSSPHPDALAVSQQILHLLHTNLAVTPSIPHPTPSAPLHCKVPAPDSRYTPHSLSPPLAQDPDSPSPAQSSTIPAVYPHDSNTRDSCSSGNASNALRQPESISPAPGASGYRCSPPGNSLHPAHPQSPPCTVPETNDQKAGAGCCNAACRPLAPISSR